MELKGKIVFSSGKKADYDIWTLDLESKEIKQLTSESSVWNDCPKWSPDGRKIAFVSNRTGSPEIWVMDEDGSNQKRITEDNKWHNTPDWSPDGGKFVFCANYEDNFDVYVMGIDGKNLRRLTTYPETDYTPQFSPDGRTIVFASERSGNADIWTYDISTGKLNQLTDHEGRDYAPTYSPDGKRIAFISGYKNNEGYENLDLCMMDADGENEIRITANLGDDRHVAWSPCGKYVIFTSSKRDRTAERLMVHEVGTKKAKEVKFERSQLDREIDAYPVGVGIFSLFPEDLRRAYYPDIYFGTERYPDWKY